MKKVAVVVTALTTAAAAAAVVVLVRQWKRRSERRRRHAQRILRKFARDCATPVSKLWQVADDLVSSMLAGLSSNQSGLLLRASRVASLPTGDEKGMYYGINLRATNFLILQARLGGKNEPISELCREEVPIPPNVMTGSSKELCDLIAVELAKFVTAHSNNGGTEMQETQRKLGFSLSTPMEKSVSSSGVLAKWMSFAQDETVQKELIQEINEALVTGGINMEVSMMDDDIIGVLCGGRYYNKESTAAFSLGLSTRFAYIESASALDRSRLPPAKSDEMVINMQWGNFKPSQLPITEFDASLDAESSDPGTGIFEKLISSKHLGEIVRRIVVKMAQEAFLFGDDVPSKLATPYLLGSPDMAAMHQDTSEDYEVINEKLREIFGITNSNPVAREIVAEVCDVVAERGARLLGACMVGVAKKLGRIENKRTVVTVDGGLYEHYRIFRNYLHSSIWEMLGSDLSDNVIVEHSHGGSGAGAIFLAVSQSQTFDS